MSAATSRTTCRGAILVIDDDAAMRAMLRDLLWTAGFDVIEACTAAEAIQAVEARGANISLVVSDVRLPEGEVFSSLAPMREAIPHVPVLLLSSFPSARLVQRSEAAAVARLMSSPIDIDDLLAVVGQLCTPPSKRGNARARRAPMRAPPSAP